MESLYIGILGGAIFGFGTAVTGIFKNRKKEDYVGFDWVQTGTTIALTTIAGAIIGSQNLELTENALAVTGSSLAAVGASEWVGNIIKGIWNWYKAITTKK